jgi:hypothetical protein
MTPNGSFFGLGDLQVGVVQCEVSGNRLFRLCRSITSKPIYSDFDGADPCFCKELTTPTLGSQLAPFLLRYMLSASGQQLLMQS